MLTECNALTSKKFEFYNVIPLRSPAHTVNTSLPFPPPAEDYADGSWTKWLNTPALEQSPYLKSIVDTFREKTSVTLVRLLRLAPNAVVEEHTDPTLGLDVEKSVIRFTIPILNNDQVVFNLNNTPVPMQPGECWYLNLINPHKVINLGNTERINLTIDLAPNTWIRNMITESQLVLN